MAEYVVALVIAAILGLAAYAFVRRRREMRAMTPQQRRQATEQELMDRREF